MAYPQKHHSRRLLRASHAPLRVVLLYCIVVGLAVVLPADTSLPLDEIAALAPLLAASDVVAGNTHPRSHFPHFHPGNEPISIPTSTSYGG